jgi:hypothetical protein
MNKWFWILSRNQNNNNGGSLIAVLIIAVVGMIMLQMLTFSSRSTVKKSGRHMAKMSSLNIAEAGKEDFYSKLKSKQFIPQPNTNVTISSNKPFAGGTFTVTCETGSNAEMLYITSSGAIGGETTNVEITALFAPEIPTDLSKRVGGAIVSRYNVDINGSCTVDGNDYDSLNNLHLPISGVYGVWTCMELFLQGSAQTGGGGQTPVNKKDLPAWRSVVAYENAPVTASLSSPEAFLGVPSGSLEKFRTSNLTTPFHGIVYIDQDIGPVHFGNSSGILIVHNATKTATLKANGGTFKGLIICDDIDKVNGGLDILGAVVSLSESTGNWNFVGNSSIHYSSQVLDNLQNYCENNGMHLDEQSWKEVAQFK